MAARMGRPRRPKPPAMLERVLAELMLWAMRGGLAWFVIYEYTSYVEQKFDEVTRALNAIGGLGGM